VGLYSVFPSCVPTKSKRERVIMSESIDIAPGQQRLFQDRAGRCVLLHKAGIAVSFIMDEDGTARVVERIEGIDFKATGSQLKRDGWTCIGPGMAYARLLEPESGGDDPDVHQ
jgi:hypothetical protein